MGHGAWGNSDEIGADAGAGVWWMCACITV